MQENMPSLEQIKLAFSSKIKKGKADIETADAVISEEIPFIQVFDEFVKECGTQNNRTIARL